MEKLSVLKQEWGNNMKAYIEFDMPKSCIKCPCSDHRLKEDFVTCKILQKTMYLPIHNTCFSRRDNEKMDNCPLNTVKE
jgi:hypothetical protein